MKLKLKIFRIKIIIFRLQIIIYFLTFNEIKIKNI